MYVLCCFVVYSKLYSLQQIVVTYKLQVYIIFNGLQLIATDQSVSYYTLHSFVAFVFLCNQKLFYLCNY